MSGNLRQSPLLNGKPSSVGWHEPDLIHSAQLLRALCTVHGTRKPEQTGERRQEMDAGVNDNLWKALQRRAPNRPRPPRFEDAEPDPTEPAPDANCGVAEPMTGAPPGAWIRVRPESTNDIKNSVKG